MNNFLILPHQLFPIEDKSIKYYLYEHPLLFKRNGMKFSKVKLSLYRASMRSFYYDARNKGFNIDYIEYDKKINIKEAKVFDPIDDYLIEYLEENIELEILDTPNFINTKKEIEDFDFKGRYSQTTFYNYQRKHRDIFMKGGKPIGDKYSFDADNRKKLPKDIELPKIKKYSNEYYTEAKEYIEKNFSDHPGNVNSCNLYPITREDAEKAFDDFLYNRLTNFGPYQDAIDKEESFLFHSNISFALNVGLLDPREIIDKLIKKYNGSNISSIEGFLRQILGWREYMRLLYVREKKRIKGNFLNSNNRMSEKWYKGTLGIYPIDNTIERAFDIGYLHHIERLMVMANFMNLCFLEPDSVYKWFMEFAVDSYDWVMFGNVYSMGLFADGGLTTTKPYITSSNYILKMSNYKKGDWCKVWDALYYNFINKHKKVIASNKRVGTFMINQLERKKNLEDLLKEANTFLNFL